jgi:hypothetical protein
MRDPPLALTSIMAASFLIPLLVYHILSSSNSMDRRIDLSGEIPTNRVLVQLPFSYHRNQLYRLDLCFLAPLWVCLISNVQSGLVGRELKSYCK